ncbi:hypothetical protein JOC55_001133 [Paenibacillus sacheonensis]|nr:hypothetical protein [Paenibacillus sacheonensis]
MKKWEKAASGGLFPIGAGCRAGGAEKEEVATA